MSNTTANVVGDKTPATKKKSARDKTLDAMPEPLRTEVLQIAADHGVSGAEDPSWLFIRAIMGSREVGLEIKKVGDIIARVPGEIESAGVRASNEIISTMKKVASAPVVEVDVSKIEAQLQTKAGAAAIMVGNSIEKGLIAYRKNFTKEYQENTDKLSTELKTAIHNAAVEAMTHARPEFGFMPPLILSTIVIIIILSASLWGAASFIGLPLHVRIDLIDLAKNIFTFMLK
ncbi:hypothetical protein [Acidiphilium acidophilum]|uniref:hypothetical protein n=1 Tax=Acidiphilium acidophilum TaxID=76588 RepID=UPI002E8E69FE|nr:hypothetical protein [Acidiphilium acidophilum]